MMPASGTRGAGRAALGAALRVAVLCVAAAVAAAIAAAQPAPSMLLTGAWLVDGTGAPVVENAWIRIDGDRIGAIGRGTPPAVPGARVVDLTGRTIVPGLADMHVHLRDLPQAQWMLKLLLAHGVTNVKDTGNSIGNLAAIRQWLAADPRVPHLYTSGATLNGSAPNLQFLKAGAATQQALENNLAFGAQFIKVHNWVSTGALRQIAAFAREHDVYLTGHVPLGMTSVAAIDAGMTILEHVRMRPTEIGGDAEAEARHPIDLPIMLRENHWAGFDASSPALARTLDAWAKRKDRFFVDPTLVVHEALAYGDDPARTQAAEMALVSPAMRRQWNNGSAKRYGDMSPEQYALAKKAAAGQGRFIGLAHARGVRVLTGTDTPVNWVIPGLSLLQEIERLVTGGLSPVDAIRASTGRAAEALRRPERGTLAAGKVADLVIVSGNAAADIRALRNIEQVMLGGQLHERAALLEDAARHAARHTASGPETP